MVDPAGLVGVAIGISLIGLAGLMVWADMSVNGDLGDLETALRGAVIEGRLSEDKAARYLKLAMKCHRLGIERPTINEMEA